MLRAPKTTVCAISALSLFCATTALSEPAPRSPIQVSETVVDFGLVDPHAIPMKSVKITNAGEKPVTLTGVDITCICTRAELSKTAIRPGESAEVKISLDLSDYPSNSVHSRVQIGVKDDSVSVPTIEVDAEIQPELVVDPNPLDFGVVKKGRAAAVELTIAQGTERKYSVTRLETTEGIEATLIQSKHDSSPQLVNITLLPELNANRYQGMLTLHTDVPRLPTITVPVRAEFVGIQCSIEPAVIVFSKATPGSAVGTVRVVGEPGLKVTSVDSEIGLRLDVADSDPRPGETTIQIYLDDECSVGDLSGRVALTLDENGLIESRDIVVTGTVLSLPQGRLRPPSLRSSIAPRHAVRSKRNSTELLALRIGFIRCHRIRMRTWERVKN